MLQVLSGVWALLLGIVLIMLGNGMHFTLIGLRGGIEGFSAAELAIVTSGYFAGFLSGAHLTPILIRRVGMYASSQRWAASCPLRWSPFRS